jgi:hypothetical protein
VETYTHKQSTIINDQNQSTNEIYIAITMKQYIESKLIAIEQQIVLERCYNKLQSLIEDRSVIVYLLSFYI